MPAAAAEQTESPTAAPLPPWCSSTGRSAWVQCSGNAKKLGFAKMVADGSHASQLKAGESSLLSHRGEPWSQCCVLDAGASGCSEVGCSTVGPQHSLHPRDCCWQHAGGQLQELMRGANTELYCPLWFCCLWTKKHSVDPESWGAIA